MVTSDGHWGIRRCKAGQLPRPTTFRPCDLIYKIKYSNVSKSICVNVKILQLNGVYLLYTNH